MIRILPHDLEKQVREIKTRNKNKSQKHVDTPTPNNGLYEWTNLANVTFLLHRTVFLLQVVLPLLARKRPSLPGLNYHD